MENYDQTCHEIKVISLPCDTSGIKSTLSDSIFAIKTPAVTQDVATYSEVKFIKV